MWEILTMSENTGYSEKGQFNATFAFCLFLGQCRVTVDSAFRCTRPSVELHSTVLSAIPDPMSSYTRQCFSLYRTQCRTQI